MQDDRAAPSNGEDGADLVARFRQGDESAFRELYLRYEGLLLRRVERLLPGRLSRKVAVSDVLQESALVAFTRRGDLLHTDERAFRSWLLGIVEYKVRETVRRHEGAAKRSALREVTHGARHRTDAVAARQASPSEAAVGAEVRAIAGEALAALPADYREVLRLAQEEHLGLRDAAARMGRSHEAVKKLYGRALARFREEFERRGGGERA